MAKKKKIQVELTQEQKEKLQPLFIEAAKHRKQGVVIGQVWDLNDGSVYLVCQWLRPDEIIADVNKMVEREKNPPPTIITPGGWK